MWRAHVLFFVLLSYIVSVAVLSGAQSVDDSIACSDSDGGKSFAQKGTTTGVRAWWDVNTANVKQEVDACTTVCQGSVGSGISSEGQCLIEYYCSSHPQTGGAPVFAAFEVKQCENGCRDGACLSAPPAPVPVSVDVAMKFSQIVTPVDGVVVNTMQIPANKPFEVYAFVMSSQKLPPEVSLTYVNVAFSKPGMSVGSGEKDVGNFGVKYYHAVKFQGLAAGDYTLILSVRTVCKGAGGMVECPESNPSDNEIKIPVRVVEPNVPVVDLGLKLVEQKVILLKRTNERVQSSQIPENEPFFVTVQVENTGEVDTPAEVNGQLVSGGNVQFLGGELIGILKKGAVGTANIGIDGLKQGSYVVYANINNKDDKITGNNQVRIDLTVLPSQPVQQPPIPVAKQWKDNEVITFTADELLFTQTNLPLKQTEIPINTPLKARFFVTNTGSEYRILNLKAFVDDKQVAEAATGGKVAPEKFATVWVDLPALQEGQHTLKVQHEEWAISMQVMAVAPKPAGVYDAAVEVDPKKFVLYNNQFVTELTPEQARGGFLIKFTIRNKGTVLAQPLFTISNGGTKGIPESVGQLLGQNGRKEIIKPFRLYLPDNKITIEAIPTQSEGTDSDTSNNVVTTEVKIFQQEAVQNLSKPRPDGIVEWDIRATPDGDKVFLQYTPVYAHELQANKHTFVRVRARNVDKEEINAVVTAEIDGREVASKSIKIDGTHETFVSLDINVLQGGEKSLTIKLVVDDDRNINNNLLTTPLKVSGQAQQVAADIDLRLDGALISQGTVLKKNTDTTLKVAADTSIIVEPLIKSNVKDIPTFTVLQMYIDGYKYKSGGVDVRLEIDKLQPGPHKVKLVIDSENLVKETDENNNAYEFIVEAVQNLIEPSVQQPVAQAPPVPLAPQPPTPVAQSPPALIPVAQTPPPKQLDLGIAPNSFAMFDDASAKISGVNNLEVQIYFTGDAASKVPVVITFGRQKTVLLREPGQSYMGLKIPIKDRKQFPTQVHVMASAPEPDTSNNAVILPVVVKKDRKLFLLSAAKQQPPVQPTTPPSPAPKPPTLPAAPSLPQPTAPQPTPIVQPPQPVQLPCPAVDSRGWECFSRTRYVSCSEGYEVAVPLASTSCAFCCMPVIKPTCKIDVSNCPASITRFFTTTFITGVPSKDGSMCMIDNNLISNAWNRNWGLYYWKFNAPCGQVVQRQ